MKSAKQLSHIVTFLSIVITLVAVLIIPISYFYLGERYLKGKYEMEGEVISSQIMGQVISLSPNWWEFEEDRLRKFVFRQYNENVSSNYSVLNNRGGIILQSEKSLSKPVNRVKFPLLDSGIVVGMFEVSYSLWPLFKESLLIFLLTTIAGVLVIFLTRIPIQELHKAEQQLKYLATTDPLTELFNRRAIMEQLQLEVERTKRYQCIFSLIMFDIDHFKKINDSYGHDIGDEVLIKLSQLVKSKVRPMDKISRFGGEEFLILVPETSATNAYEMAEHLRKTISSYDFKQPPQLTVSIGISQFIVGDSINELLKRADIALYQAKQSGRNKVIFQQ